MIRKALQKYLLIAFCLCILLIYFISICNINFSKNSGYYSTDMYTDILYAQEAWEHKSIFPEGWIFGNQLYAVATPVLAALFYGILGDSVIAMGLASTCMGIFVLLSFDYMVKALFPDIKARLLGAVLFMTGILMFGDPIHRTNGWQLLFTMCSFYACYAITAFLTFGCYIRGKADKKHLFPLFLCCLLSFGTGLQSLRQTLIAICPLIGTELICVFLRWRQRQAPFTQRTTVAALILSANLLGVLLAILLNVPQVKIFGQMGIVGLFTPVSGLKQSLGNAFSLIGITNPLSAIILGIGGIFVFFYLSFRFRKADKGCSLCILLFVISLIGVLLLDAFTTMNIRSIYYFLLYPLIALGGILIYTKGGQYLRYLAPILLIILLISGAKEQLKPVFKPETQKNYDAVVDYLEAQGIDTVYSGWNRGEKLGIASGGKVRCGFWDGPNEPFIPVKYLCNPEIFHTEPSRCAYVFFNSGEASIAVNAARAKGAPLKLLQYFPEENVFIYTADYNLMDK